MKNLFKDQALQQEFDSNGYVIVPMLTPSDIDQLNALFQKYFPEVPIGFASSTYLSDYKTKREISDATSAIMAPKIANWLKGHRLIGSAFLSKAPDQRSQLPMHQDWTIVDEDNFDALNLWTPLTPITEENGILEMLPGSQETFRVVRAPSMPFIAQGHEELIYPHMVKLDVKPGEVVILNQAVVHFSGPNRSKESRIALTTGATSDLAS
ncbi:MAG: ectoine hydroxylase-related dioxygenase (phytanoyl-CoA dioxygenase family), partial [Granulosicoccus sp.]